MKRFLLVTLSTLLLCFCLHAQVGLEYDLEVGYATGEFGSWSSDQVVRNPISHIYDLVGLWLTFGKHFYLGGSITVQMYAMLPYFDPTFTNYNLEAGFVFKNFSLFIAHDCSHPQFTCSHMYRVTSIWGEGGVTRVGLRFSNREVSR